MGVRMIMILALGYITLSAGNVFWGVIRGAGDAISPLWASFINSVIIRLPSAYLLVYLLGEPEALMYSLTASWMFGLLLAVIVHRRGKWRTKGLVRQSHNESRSGDEGEIITSPE